MGTNGMVTSGHYLASAIGLRILERGGNAVDAAAAMGFALTVLEPHLNGIGGEVPILIYSADEGKVSAVSGQGTAPRGMTIDWFKERGIDPIPGDGLTCATVPAAVATWIEALMRFGTMSLTEVLSPAIELAEWGFPMYGQLQTVISGLASKFHEEWPTSAEIYVPNGRIPEVGEVFVQKDWATTFKKFLDAEVRSRRRGRIAALEAARAVFYRGEIAGRIAEFARHAEVLDASGRRNRGFMTVEDLSGYRAKVEEPVSVDYRGIEVYKCSTWCQGPVFLQQLTILEGYDLAGMGHNSADYIHTVIEAAKLSFADREEYYGDPDFVDVPLDRLLSKAYAARRREIINPERASMELRPGDAPPTVPKEVTGTPGAYGGDTTHLDVIDRWGNMVAATPSGAWISSSPVVPGLGFPLGTRGQMFSLDPGRANALVPGKRPRTTLTPSLAMKNGKPFMVFGTPGGDNQDQWTLQFFLNSIDFGMSLQEAIDVPTFHTLHFPSSFYPRSAYPGRIVLEGRIPEDVRAELAGRGHGVVVTGDWSNGRVLAIRLDLEHGVIMGAASPRGETGYAMGW
jgi:gamma-glutamyltranspeptidase/glutathione hydrolase